MLEYPEDWAKELERDFEDYMGALCNNIDEEWDEHSDEVLDLTGNYFCGCSECDRRATWTFIMERTIRAYRDGIITLVEENP